MRYGRWTVLEEVGRDAWRKKQLRCQCDCGRVSIVRETNLKRGLSGQCKVCHNRGNNSRKHGQSGSAEYRIWVGMIQRCTNPRRSRWPRYGGRGIKVCDRWLACFSDFLAEVGPRPSSRHSLERKNNDGNYEPGNVRWATAIEQANNRAPRRAAAR